MFFVHLLCTVWTPVVEWLECAVSWPPVASDRYRRRRSSCPARWTSTSTCSSARGTRRCRRRRLASCRRRTQRRPDSAPTTPTPQTGGARATRTNQYVTLVSGLVQDLENLDCGWILFSEFKAWKLLEFLKLVLKSLLFVDLSSLYYYLYA